MLNNESVEVCSAKQMLSKADAHATGRNRRDDFSNTNFVTSQFSCNRACAVISSAQHKAASNNVHSPYDVQNAILLHAE